MAPPRRKTRSSNKMFGFNMQKLVIIAATILVIASFATIAIITNQKNHEISKMKEQIVNSSFFEDEQENTNTNNEIENNLNELVLGNNQIETNPDMPIKKIDKKVKITAIGNIISQSAILESSKLGNGYDFSSIFKNVKEKLEGADITIGHLETSFYSKKPYSGSVVYNAPKELGQALKNIGIDMLSIANNHSLDMGIDGLNETMDYLNEIGLGYVGANKSLEDAEHIRVKTINDIKLGFLSYTYGLNPSDVVPEGKEYAVNIINKDNILEDIRKLKNSNVEYIIALCIGEM